jgi:I/LWEQ domain/ANTH domain
LRVRFRKHPKKKLRKKKKKNLFTFFFTFRFSFRVKMSAASQGQKRKKVNTSAVKRSTSNFVEVKIKRNEKKERKLAKACSAKRELAPKGKHVRSLVLASWNENSIVSYYKEAGRLPFDREAVSCFKALQVLHHLLHEGPPKALADAHNQMIFFDTIESAWSRARSASTGYNRMILEYNRFLKAKVNFHSAYQEFGGKLLLDDVLRRQSSAQISEHRAAKIVQALLALQEALLAVGAAVYKMPAGAITEAMVAALIPVTVESHNIYLLVVYFLQQLADGVDRHSRADKHLGFMIQHFYEQYPSIRNFYEDTSNVQYVISVIQVPSLPCDPPQFFPSGAADSYESTSSDDGGDGDDELVQQYQPPVQPIYTPPVVPAPAPVQSFDFAAAAAAAAQRQLSTGTAAPASAGWVQFQSFEESLLSPRSAQLQQQAIVQPSDVLGTQRLTADFLARAAPPAGAEPAPQPVPEPTPPPAASQAKVDESVQQQQQRAKLTESDLKRRLLALQALFKKEREKNLRLEAQLKAKDAEVAQWKQRCHSLLKEKETLTREHADARDARDALQERVAALERDVEAEQRRNAMQQLNAAKANLDRSLSALLGQAAGLTDRPEDVLSANAALARAMAALLTAKTPEARAAAVQAISDATEQLLAQVRSVAAKIDDPLVREALLGATQRVAATIGRLLDVVQMTPDDEAAIRAAVIGAKAALDAVSHVTTEFIDAQAQAASSSDAANDQFADEATRELMQAAARIEAAAESLRATKARQKPKLSDTDVAISDAIVDAAMAIAETTQRLVRQATVVQQENVAAGRARSGVVSASWYKKNAKWSQGLISAAKAVAEGTSMLVHAANETANGRVQEEALIASSMSVSASTAQLIAAARVRSDPNSSAQQHLESAAKAVSASTQKLVDAARSARTLDEDDSNPLAPVAFTSTVLRMKAQQEAQMQVLELEKQLERARSQLCRVNESQYSN